MDGYRAGPGLPVPYLVQHYSKCDPWITNKDKIWTEMKNKHLETLIAFWPNNFMSFESESKKNWAC